MEPKWIRLDVVISIHDAQLAEHGGLDGLRDRNGLESALASPKNLLAYGDPKPDIAELAAQYAFAIARNQVFVDGNKRTALVVYRTFLLLNGQNLIATNEEKYHTIMQLSEGQLTVDQMADWIRSHLADPA
ncbi:type II toxin-antitoxin system death-on-curing family toxin [Bremerella sp. JC817]|uniref:type II toxin-antitoxin system death-on-curing family toxin n=1 Tax=Bremerella sp. JC817 TaxID=3231756 RepID=UPI003458CAFF